MNTIVILLYVIAGLGQLIRLSLSGQTINILLTEPLILLFITLGLYIYINKGKKIKSLAFIKPIWIFLSVLVFSFLAGIFNYTLFENYVGFLYLMRLTMYLLFFSLLIDFVSKNKNKILLQKSLSIFMYMTILFSFTQFFLYPDLRNLQYLGWDPHHHRVFGLFFDTTIAAIIYCLLFFWRLFTIKNLKTDLNIKNGLILLLLFTLFVLTYSRIGYISFILAFLYYAKSKVRLKYLTLLVVGFVTLLFLLPRPEGEGVRLERIFSIQSRVSDIRQGLNLTSKNPLLGVGYNRIRFSRDVDGITHAGANFSSSYVSILASSGLIGMIAFFYLIYSLWIKIDYRGRTLLILVLIASSFDNIFLVNIILFTAFSIMSMYVSKARK